jgi:uncharacterized protein (DUF924 family)
MPKSILHVWFKELTPKQHVVKDAALDETIRVRFGDTLEATARCELFAWRATAQRAAGGDHRVGQVLAQRVPRHAARLGVSGLGSHT